MSNSARLPNLLSLPVSVVPSRLHSIFITQILNILLASQQRDGELDFLHHKTLHVCIEDAGMEFSISRNNSQLVPGNTKQYDIRIAGNVHDFLLLISRSEDADTLFFQRRLKLQGDTELGLYLKNFLDGIDVDSLPFYQVGHSMLIKAIHMYERLFANKTVTIT